MQLKLEQTSTVGSSDLVRRDAYPVYFSLQLEEDEFGKGRDPHNAICNPHLLAQLEHMEEEGLQLFEHVSNASLIANIKKNPDEPPDKTLTWHHVNSKTAPRNEQGLMHLVLTKDHESKTFSRAFHPQQKGGFYEWAIPHGAPVKKPKGMPKDVRIEQIKTLTKEELAPALMTATGKCAYDKIQALIERAQELSVSADTVAEMFNQYHQGTPLLNFVAQHGNCTVLNIILPYLTTRPQFPQLADDCGNTPAHVAADKGRISTLKILKDAGTDLTIRNKKNLTAYETIRVYSTKEEDLIHCVPPGQSEEEFVQSIEEAKQQDRAQSKSTLRDPEFVYGGLPSGNKGTSEAKLSRKTYRELMGLPAQPTIEELAAREAPELERKQAPKKTFRELMGLPAQPTKEELAAREARELERKQAPKKTFREIMGLPAQPTKEELAAREARELERKQEPKKTFREIMRLPAQPTKEELVAREARELERKQAPKKTYREQIGLPAQPSKEALVARETGDAEKIKGQALQRNTPKKIELSPRYSIDNRKDTTSPTPFKPQQNSFSAPSVTPIIKPMAYKKEKQQLATSDALQKIVNARIEKQAKQLRDTEHKKEKTLHLKDETQIKQQKIEQQKSNQQPLQKYEPPRSEQTKKTVKFHSPSPASEQSRGTSTHQHSQLKDPQQHIQQQAQQRAQQQAQQRIQQQAQQRIQQQAQQRIQQQAQQRIQQQAQQRIQQQAQQRIQQQAQQRIQQQAQQRIQQQAQQRIQQQAQQRIQQQAQQQVQQRAQQQAQQRAQQQAQQRAQQQAQQRAQQQAQQRAQQQAQQRAQQQAQQRAQQQAQQRAQQQAQQRAQQQAQQRAQQQAQQRAQQQAQQRAQQQAQQRAQQQAQQQAQQRAQQQAQQQAQQRAQQQAQQQAQQRAQQQAQQRAQQQAQQQAQQRAQQQAQQRAQQQAQQAAAARAAQQAAAARAAQQAAAARAAQQQAAAAARAQQAAANQRAYRR
ncbi:TPA: hypothetical protein ACPSKE_002758 [Legionella feeleii]